MKPKALTQDNTTVLFLNIARRYAHEYELKAKHLQRAYTSVNEMIHESHVAEVELHIAGVEIEDECASALLKDYREEIKAEREMASDIAMYLNIMIRDLKDYDYISGSTSAGWAWSNQCNAKMILVFDEIWAEVNQNAH